jgi:hypothetical protein
MSGGTENAWTSISSLAALGTARATQSVDSLWPEPSLAMPGETPESTLLRVAAASYLWQLAGSRAVIASPPATEAVENAPPLEDRLVSEVAAWRMGRMLSGDHRDLLPEWFALAARFRLVLPPQWLPVVLSTLRPSELEGIAAVLGRRAVWLVARNPAWHLRDGAVPPSAERWETGTLVERGAELTALRTADPAAALAWIQKTWETDPPDAREAFVRVLLKGLSTADEAFLEIALGDKRKAVRTAAVECLSRLPNSAHALRNLARLEPLLTFDPPASSLLGKLKKRRLHVELPAGALGKQAVRDGIEANVPANRKIGERTWWLVQMVSLVPPSHWTTRFGCDARTLVEAVTETDYSDELMAALTEAAGRHADENWLAELLRLTLAKNPPSEPKGHGAVMELINGAPVAARERLIWQALESLDETSFTLALVLLNTSGADWSPELTRRAFELLGQRVRTDVQSYSFPHNTLAFWGRHAHLETALAEIERVDAKCPDPSSWRNAVEALKEIIGFRAAMRQELSK